jgi:hypothetical protein
MGARSAFFQVPYSPHPTSSGNVMLPIAYRDNNHLVALFSVDTGPVADKLSEHGFAPVVVRGRAQVALVFFEYTESAIGPYNEVGLASFAVPLGQQAPRWAALEMLRDPRKRSSGTFVHHLPVTSEAAFVAGRELWGYPKFVTQLPIEWRGREFSGAVLDPSGNSSIVELAGRRGLGVPIPALQVLTYTRLGSQALQTPVDVRGWGIAARAGSMRVHVGTSQHPMAQTLRAFGLDGATPELVVVARHAWSLLHGGNPLPHFAQG